MEPGKQETIVAHMRDAITAGTYAPGDLLPSEEGLAAEHDAGRGTAHLAYKDLEREGLVERGRGRAGRRVAVQDPLVFYASRSESMARADQRKTRGVDAWVMDCEDQGRTGTQDIRIEVIPPPARVAASLGLKLGQDAAARKRIRYVDGRPHNLNTTWYPLDIAEGTAIMRSADITEGIVEYMRQMGHTQVRYIDEVEARMPTYSEAEDLRMPLERPVLAQTRTGYTAERPVKVTVTVWPPSNGAKLVYELPA
jgi:GntR family transcriptional regulator